MPPIFESGSASGGAERDTGLWRPGTTLFPVTLKNASDYWANGLLSDYIGWTNGLRDY